MAPAPSEHNIPHAKLQLNVLMDVALLDSVSFLPRVLHFWHRAYHLTVWAQEMGLWNGRLCLWRGSGVPPFHTPERGSLVLVSMCGWAWSPL